MLLLSVVKIVLVLGLRSICIFALVVEVCFAAVQIFYCDGRLLNVFH